MGNTMDVTYDDIAKKANELGLYICEFFINDADDGVCYWNRTGEKEDETIIEVHFKWDKHRKGAQTAGKLISMSVCYERLGVPSNCSLPYSGFFQIGPPEKEVCVFVGNDTNNTTISAVCPECGSSVFRRIEKDDDPGFECVVCEVFSLSEDMLLKADSEP